MMPAHAIHPEAIRLSSVSVPTEAGILRACPRPQDQRDANFDEQFDWTTLFYDVYRLGEQIIFQGPPFFDFFPLLEATPLLKRKFRGFRPAARHVDRKGKGSEIWLRHSDNRVVLDGPLGRFDIAVQPNLSELLADRRVLHSLSKDNDIRWIKDWITFYTKVHGANAVLLYDNGSSAYTASQLQDELRSAFPEIMVVVVSWPFAYGPQGGMAGAVDGREAPWDSDYCQTGSLQHARLRFLTRARSVLNVDIDELVLSTRNRSIFEATERSWGKFVKFGGTWISATTAAPVDRGRCRHGDFWLLDRDELEACPAKWCIVPGSRHLHDHTWSVHNLFGARKNRRVSGEFGYRHLKGISNGWKYNRWDAPGYDPARFREDSELRRALLQADLTPTCPAGTHNRDCAETA